MFTFKLSGQEISKPPLQQWSNASHEEKPHSPARSPESTTWTFSYRTLKCKQATIYFEMLRL